MKFVPWIVALVAVGILSGCKSMGGGLPAGQAQVTVQGVSEAQIQEKAEDVFHRHGFEYKGATLGRMEFERDGGFMDNALYGNWRGNDVLTRVTLFITSKGPMTYTLRTRSIALRRTFGADSDDEQFDVQGGRYGVILKKIAAELSAENPR